MPRIDHLTAQMRQRAVSRVSICADQRIQLFDANDQLLGAGAPLSGQVVGEILSQIAPGPLDGAPVAFPYHGRDGQFQISVAPGGQTFEVRALSFTADSNSSLAPAAQPSLQTHSQTQGGAFAPAPASEAEWFYLVGEQQIGPTSPAQIKALIRQGQIKSDTLLWSAGLPQWQSAGQTEFKALLPALPSAPTPTAATAPATDYFGNPINTSAAPALDSAGAWFYRSATGQSVPLDRAALVAKIRGKALSPETLVWREGMSDWQSASTTELAREISGAPISSPTGAETMAPRTFGSSNPYNVYGTGDPANTSGSGWEAPVPREARGWFNLGAFLFPTWWCRAHNLDSWATGIVVLNVASRWFFPLQVVKLPVCVGLGFMGNTIAWRMRRFNDVADFKKCQFLWAMWSLAASVLLWGALALLFGSAVYSARSSYRPFPTSSRSFSNGQTFGNGQSFDSGQSSGSP